MFAWVHILIITTSLILVGGIIRGRQTIGTYLDLLKSRKVLADAVTKLEHETGEIEFEIHKIKSSPIYAKKVLREKYHVTEENESIIFFGD